MDLQAVDTPSGHLSVTTSTPRCPSRRLAGYLPTGMLDWPGLVSTTIFLSGCSLRCPYCHNPELLSVHEAPDTWEQLLSHLTVRRGWIDGVVVTGGEPTADPGIFSLLEALVSRGLRVKLDSNGMSPDTLAAILESGLVDFVALDVKTLPSRYSSLGATGDGAALTRSISAVIRSGVDHEFRTTVYPPLIQPEELPHVAALLDGGSLYVLQQYRPDRTLEAAAAEVTPATPLELLAAREQCSRYLPTITRGV